MEIKTKLAALLRRWAYALHPETPATLPPGYQVKKVVSNLSHFITDGKMPPKALVEEYKRGLAEEVLAIIKGAGYIRHRTDIHLVPGEMCIRDRSGSCAGLAIPTTKKPPGT